MKTIDLLLLGTGGYFLYRLLTQKESTGPIQEIPNGSIDNHNSEKLVESNKEISSINQDPAGLSKQDLPAVARGVETINKDTSTQNLPVSPQQNSSGVTEKVLPTVYVGETKSKTNSGADSYLISIGIPNLQGLFGSESTYQKDTNMYDLNDIPFYSLSEGTKTILLRCFALDYTSPRMIKDDKLYDKAIEATNKTGAPAGWVQYVSCMALENGISSDDIDVDKLITASIKMLSLCENETSVNEKINLSVLRKNAISAGLTSLQLGHV